MLHRQKTQSATASRRGSEILSLTDQSSPSREARALLDQVIRLRAYELYCARGDAPDNALEDWLQAEREYRGMDGGHLELTNAPADRRHNNNGVRAG
jgi:hypothetical protein